MPFGLSFGSQTTGLNPNAMQQVCTDIGGYVMCFDDYDYDYDYDYEYKSKCEISLTLS